MGCSNLNLGQEKAESQNNKYLITNSDPDHFFSNTNIHCNRCKTMISTTMVGPDGEPNKMK
jgi:hypothetical protein